MTAPDLDALAHTVDAMRQAGVSGVTLSVDEADALIAAARERDALTDRWCKDGETLAERLQRERDETGWLMGLLAAERQRAEQAEQREARLRAALEYIKPSLPVLATMCQTAGFALAEAKARDMHATVSAALAEGQDG